MKATPEITLPIGEIIQTRVEYLGMSKAKLARRLNMSSANVHKIFKRKTIEVTLLCRISEELKYDFLELYRIEVMRHIRIHSSLELDGVP